MSRLFENAPTNQPPSNADATSVPQTGVSFGVPPSAPGVTQNGETCRRCESDTSMASTPIA